MTKQIDRETVIHGLTHAQFQLISTIDGVEHWVRDGRHVAVTFDDGVLSSISPACIVIKEGVVMFHFDGMVAEGFHIGGDDE